MPCLFQPHLRKPCPRGLSMAHSTGHTLRAGSFMLHNEFTKNKQVAMKSHQQPSHHLLRRPVSSTFRHSQVSAFLPPPKEAAWGRWIHQAFRKNTSWGRGVFRPGLSKLQEAAAPVVPCTWYPAKQAVGGDDTQCPSGLAEPPPRSNTMSRKRGGHCSSWATTQPVWRKLGLPPASVHTECKLHFCYSHTIQPPGPPHVFRDPCILKSQRQGQSKKVFKNHHWLTQLPSTC